MYTRPSYHAPLLQDRGSSNAVEITMGVFVVYIVMHNIFSELFGFERRITSWATSQITPDPTGLSTPGSVEEYSPHSPRIQPLAITEDVLNRSAWCPPPLVIQQLRPFFCPLHREKHRPLPREKSAPIHLEHTLPVLHTTPR